MIPPTQLTEMIESLPTDERQRGVSYVSVISREYNTKANQANIKFEWAGGVSELKEQYNSVELQKKAMEWMSGPSL